MDRTWLAAVLLAVAVLVAGCGGPEAGPGANNTTETTAANATDVVTETPEEDAAARSVSAGPAADVGALPPLAVG